jgi:hypothetical protein
MASARSVDSESTDAAGGHLIACRPRGGVELECEATTVKTQKNGEFMNRHLWALSLVLVPLGCASYPAPTEHLASAMAEVRAAQEVGSGGVPRAELQLKLAQDEIAQARAFINDGKTERADYMTLRAYNDAALAVALSRENVARARAEAAATQATTPTPSPSP